MIENPIKTWWKARKVFKRPRYIVDISKRSFTWKSLLSLESSDVITKDKRGTPRLERSPYIILGLLWWTIYIYIYGPDLLVDETYDEDQYWEQMVWAEYYQEGLSSGRTLTEEDWNKAKNSWPWETEVNGEKKSTWEDGYHV